MKIAIIGTGIAGNVAAHKLHRDHDITVYEAAAHVGGHTHTHAVELDGEQQQVDTGFIVFNDWTYPNFIALLAELGVESQASDDELQRAQRAHRARVQRHFAERAVRAAPQPAAARRFTA